MKMPSSFPNEIDLGKTPGEACSPCMSTSETKGKKKKPKPYYPSLYLSGIDGLEGIPKEGYALVMFKRRSITISQDQESEDPRTSADLEIQSISFPEVTSEEATGDMQSELAKFAKSQGVADAESDDEDDDE